MSSNYNSRVRAPEVLVDGREFTVVRKRETFEDLVRNEAVQKVQKGRGPTAARRAAGTKKKGSVRGVLPKK